MFLMLKEDRKRRQHGGLALHFEQIHPLTLFAKLLVQRKNIWDN